MPDSVAGVVGHVQFVLHSLARLLIAVVCIQKQGITSVEGFLLIYPLATRALGVYRGGAVGHHCIRGTDPVGLLAGPPAGGAVQQVAVASPGVYQLGEGLAFPYFKVQVRASTAAAAANYERSKVDCQLQTANCHYQLPTKICHLS
jgi:hypothetical protein